MERVRKELKRTQSGGKLDLKMIRNKFSDTLHGAVQLVKLSMKQSTKQNWWRLEAGDPKT